MFAATGFPGYPANMYAQGYPPQGPSTYPAAASAYNPAPRSNYGYPPGAAGTGSQGYSGAPAPGYGLGAGGEWGAGRRRAAGRTGQGAWRAACNVRDEEGHL